MKVLHQWREEGVRGWRVSYSNPKFTSPYLIETQAKRGGQWITITAFKSKDWACQEIARLVQHIPLTCEKGDRPRP